MVNDFWHVRILSVFGVIAAPFLLAGCVTASGPISRSLPPSPSNLMRPVPVPKLYKGEDARAALRLTGTALIEANSRLSASSRWYENVRQSYGGK